MNFQYKWDKPKTNQFSWLQRKLNITDEEFKKVFEAIKIRFPGDEGIHIWDAMVIVIAKLIKEPTND